MRVLIVEDEPDMAQVLKESTLTSQRLAPPHKGKRPTSEVIWRQTERPLPSIVHFADLIFYKSLTFASATHFCFWTSKVIQEFSRGVSIDRLINTAIWRVRSNIIVVLTGLVGFGLAVVTPSSILADNSNNRKNVGPGTFWLTGSM